MNANAVTRRLDKLQALWDTFRELPDGRVCRWAVKQDELPLIDAFYQVNAAEQSDTPDIFLRFESAFPHQSTFGKILSEELSNLVEDDRPALAEEGIEIPWHSDHRDFAENTALGFLRNFFHFASSLDLDEDSLVVAFIYPAAFSDGAGWKKWWADALALDIPPKIRLMVCDTLGDELLNSVAKKYPEKMATYRPDLNMPNAVRELMNEYGDQDDGCTHFRKAFFELTQQVSQRDAGGIRQTAQKALALAKQVGFPHLEVAVLCTAATGFVSAGQLETGMKTYDEAKRVAKAAEPLPLIKEMPELKVDLPGGNIFGQLGVQVSFFKAAGLLGASPPQYERALEAYQQASAELKQLIAGKGNPEKADWTNGGILCFHQLEALRMSGYCLERLGKSQEALKTYNEAVQIAERLDAEARKSTTLAFVGKALLDIYRAKAMKQEYHHISDKMNALLGKGWEETLPKKAA